MFQRLIFLLIAIAVCVKAGSPSKVSSSASSIVKKGDNAIKSFFSSVVDATKGQVIRLNQLNEEISNCFHAIGSHSIEHGSHCIHALLYLTYSHIFCYRYQSVKAAIKDTSVNGIEGFNIQWEVPFDFQDYVVGFKYNVGGLKKTPETLYVKKSFATSGMFSFLTYV